MSDTFRIPKGSVVLVTASTGLIGSAVVDDLLKRGYKVKGTTRSAAKAAPLAKSLEEQYGAGSFTIAEIPDASASNAYDRALQDVAGIIHIASDISYSPDIEKVVENSKAYTLNILEAASATPTVRSVVITGSSVGALVPPLVPGKNMKLDRKSFSEFAYIEGKELANDNPFKPQMTYNASKGESERAAWEFYKSKQPGFALNTILPVIVTGPIGNSVAGATSLTGNEALKLFNGDTTGLMYKWASPSLWIVDARDVATLHVGALLNPQTSSQRLFGIGHNFNINDVLQYWRSAFPDKADTIPANLDFEFVPGDMPDRSKEEELLQRFQGHSWRSLEDTFIDAVKV